MGPKWILVRLRARVAEDNVYSVFTGPYIHRIALSPPESGREINRLSAHAAIGFMVDAGFRNADDRDGGFDKCRSLQMIDSAIRLLDEAMQ